MRVRTIWTVAVASMVLGCGGAVESEQGEQGGAGGAAEGTADGGAEAAPPPLPVVECDAPKELVAYCYDVESLSTPEGGCSLAHAAELAADPLCFPGPLGGFCCCDDPSGTCVNG